MTLKKIGISLALILLVGCASNKPAPVEYTEVAKANEALLMNEPEYVKYTVKGLDSVECVEGTCTMSENDFRQNQHDKRALLDLHKLDHATSMAQVQAYNNMVYAQTHNEVALAKKDAAIYYLDEALKEERTYNAVKTWAERLLFILGIAVIGSL